MKELSFKLEDMDFEEKEESKEQIERKKRSFLMNQKVNEINRKREEAERQEIERKRIAELTSKKEEEIRKLKIKEEKNRKKNESKRNKQKEALKTIKEEELKQRGITKVPEKFNTLVGEYKNLLAIPGSGNCQPSAKAAILLQDPSRGLELAIEENSYIVEHWDKFFCQFFSFPHEAKLRGGQTKVFITETEFLEFLVLNPEVSYMWADHHQLLVTANQYNTTVQVLTIDQHGNGRLLQEPIKPNPELAPYFLLPPTRPDGEVVDVPEVWLCYTGGNHYEALLKDDHPLITEGSLKERGLLQKAASIDEKKVENKISEETDLKCDDCQFSFTSEENLKLHKEATGHKMGFWQVFDEENKVTSQAEADSKLMKEVLEFELVDKNTNNNDLIKERKAHKETQKIIKALEDELRKCKAELRYVQEEKDRLKIQNEDFKSVTELSKNLEELPSLNKNTESVLVCAMCEYPFKTQAAVKTHQEKHKKETENTDMSHDCGICGTELSSNNEFRKHIKIKHTIQFNCNKCDFQGSSQIILTKHLNLKHRNQDDQESGTLVCSQCREQFSSIWNLKNHMRDRHAKTEVCKWFRDGDCRFPEKDCWNKHETRELILINVTEEIKCHTCKTKFKTKDEMMRHRLKNHQEKVKDCRDGENCSRQGCWYKHKTVIMEKTATPEEEISDRWVNSELDSENTDFPQVPIQPAPPTNQNRRI